MIYPIRTLVAAVATLDEQDPVLAPALELAERTGATLHLVHAFEAPGTVWDAVAAFAPVDADAFRLYVEGVQERLEAWARSMTTSGRVRCHAVSGPAAPVIREVALRERADLILVGATRHGAFARAVLGTTAQRVIRGAPAPVLIVRGPLPARLERVLLTTDLSTFSAGIHEAGLDVLESLCGGEGSEIRSLLVVGYALELPPPLRSDRLEALAERELGEFLRERRERARPVEGVVSFGDPAREIVREAGEWGADLLVLGTHGRTAPKRWMLGSVAEAAMRGAPCHTLVIPARVEAQRMLPVPLDSARPVPDLRAPGAPAPARSAG